MKSPGLYAIEEGGQEKRKRSLKLILEKKLAILERAIESNQSSVELKLAKLKLCAEFWEPSTLVKEWQKLIFLHPNNTALWQKYLLFCQSQFSTFSVSKIHSLYGKCLSTLSAVKDGSILSHPELPGTEEAMFGKETGTRSIYVGGIILFLKDFVYLFLERGEGREKERERNINVWLPVMCPLLGT